MAKTGDRGSTSESTMLHPIMLMVGNKNMVSKILIQKEHVPGRFMIIYIYILYNVY